MATAIDHRLGLRLRETRERRGLAQAQLAALIDVPVRAVQDWEDGREALNLWQIIGLAEALDVAPAALREMPGKPLRRAISTAGRTHATMRPHERRSRPEPGRHI